MFIKISKLRKAAGASLVEFVVNFGVGLIVIGSTAALWIYSSTSFAGMYSYVDLDNQGQNALDRLSQRIRRAQSLRTMNTNGLGLTLVDFDGNDLQLTYDPSARKLTQTKEGVNEVLLSDVDSLSFSIFQRNPVNGAYDQYPAADASSCKLIQIQWSCSRSLFGRAAYTGSLRTAKVVIRRA